MARRRRGRGYRDMGVSDNIELRGNETDLRVRRPRLNITQERGADVRLRRRPGGIGELRVRAVGAGGSGFTGFPAEDFRVISRELGQKLAAHKKRAKVVEEEVTRLGRERDRLRASWNPLNRARANNIDQRITRIEASLNGTSTRLYNRDVNININGSRRDMQRVLSGQLNALRATYQQLAQYYEQHGYDNRLELQVKEFYRQMKKYKEDVAERDAQVKQQFQMASDHLTAGPLKGFKAFGGRFIGAPRRGDPIMLPDRTRRLGRRKELTKE